MTMDNKLHAEIVAETEHLRGEVAALDYYDCNVWLGRADHFPLASELRIKELAGILKRYQMRGACISHWAGYSAAAQVGNQALLELENDLPAECGTIWTALPPEPEEPGPLPGKDVDYGKMCGVRVFPESHRYRFLPWVVGDLCRWCGRRGLPIFVWHVEINWNDLYTTARAFPECHFILETQWQKILYPMRQFFGLCATCPNIYAEISNLIGQDYLAQAVRRVGPKRLLYGSFLPMNDPLIPIGIIGYSGISDKDKRLIAGDNLRRLLGGVQL